MSKELAKTYDPKGIEERLYTKWMDNGYFHAKVNPDQYRFQETYSSYAPGNHVPDRGSVHDGTEPDQSAPEQRIPYG